MSLIIKLTLFLVMFGLFKKKSEKEKLEEKYEQLLKEAFNLSKTNRKLSDLKQEEANEILKKVGGVIIAKLLYCCIVIRTEMT